MIPTSSQDVQEAREVELERQEHERELELIHARVCCDGWLIGEDGTTVACLRCRPREYALEWAHSQAEQVVR